MRDFLAAAVILGLALLYCFLIELEARVTFLHAWSVVKKERLDRLARGVCEEECKYKH